MKYPKVFIIILNYNGKECIERTLSDVFKLDYPNFKVVLVDNNSTDGSLEIARNKFPKIPLIRNQENLGFSAGNNKGIKYALERGADYVMLLNYDIGLEKKSLFHLIEAAEKDTRIGVACPLIFEKDNARVWFSGGKIKWIQMKAVHERKVLSQDFLCSDYITGAAILIKKEVFKKIGLLDEEYFLYWEDADFSVRAKRAGYKLLVSAKSHMVHFEKSEQKKEKKIYWLVLSGLLFFKKNSPFWLRPWIFFYTLARKMKNLRDLKLGHDPIKESVKKAYHDFKYAK